MILHQVITTHRDEQLPSNAFFLFFRISLQYFSSQNFYILFLFCSTYLILCGPGYLSRYSDSLPPGRSGNRIPVGPRFSAPVQIVSGTHPASFTIRTGSFPWIKRQGHGVDHPPYLAPRLKKVQSYNFPPPLGFRGLFKVKFTFTLFLTDFKVTNRLHLSNLTKATECKILKKCVFKISHNTVCYLFALLS